MTSLVHGVVTKVLVDVGDMVRAGQIVAYVNCPEISDAQSAYVERKAHRIEAAANVELAKRRLSLSESESRRLLTLLNEGIAAKKDVENAQSRSASTEAELQTAQAMLSSADIQLAAAKSRLNSLGLNLPSMVLDNVTTELPLRSPISGLVSQKTAQPGQQVGPLSGTTNSSLITVVDLKKVWVMLEVPQSEIAEIKLGAGVTFTTEVAPGKKFKGTVEKLGQTFDSMSRTASVRTAVDNPDSILKPGMMVLADVSVPQSKTHILVPSTSIQKISNRNLIFKKVDATAFKACPVSLGKSDGVNTEVVAGLLSGETIATKGSFLLKSELMKNSIGGEQ